MTVKGNTIRALQILKYDAGSLWNTHLTNAIFIGLIYRSFIIRCIHSRAIHAPYTKCRCIDSLVVLQAWLRFLTLPGTEKVLFLGAKVGISISFTEYT